MRADRRLVELGLAQSRSRAQAEIASGNVVCEGEPVAKAGQPVARDAALEISGQRNPWVSRGGLKLDAALERFGIAAQDKIALDLGASTGGFTQVLLARGAARIYAVDVGHNQLHAKLRADPRIVSREGVNARELDAALVPEPIDLIVADVSFISLKLVLPPALALASPGAALVALIKPQFEAGRSAVKKGIVRDPRIHERVCKEISDFIAALPGWRAQGVMASPIEGGDGNKEFLIAARRAP